jgi:hypothetical protein
MYSQQATDLLYAHLADSARELQCAGINVIVDATFGARDKRALMRGLALQLGVPLRVIHCHAPVEELRRRIRQRAAQGTDASEADLAVLDWQLRNVEPVRADEGLATIEVDTSVHRDTGMLSALAGEVLRGVIP